MLKILLALLLTILATPLYAWGPATLVAGTSGAAASCNGQLGSSDTYVTNNGVAAGLMECFLYTADCTGPLKNVVLYSRSDAGAKASVCIYSDLGTANVPDTSDLKLACTSSLLEDASATWVSGAMSSYTVTSGTKYWVCMIGNTATWTTRANMTGSVYYSTGFDATTPPATLQTLTAGAYYENLYITIGP